MRRHVLGIALFALLAACGGRAPSGPAWPKSAGTDVEDEDAEDPDRGESLEPKQTSAVAAVESSAGAEPAKTDEPAVPAADLPKPATDAPKPTTDTPPTPTTDPPIVDEIVIEVKPD